MIIRKPLTATKDKANPYTTVLHFEHGERLKFYMRGAIGWPEGTKEGFAVMAGQFIETGQIVIFEQFRFWTVSHWLTPDGSLRPRDNEPGHYHTGLVQFIQDCESLYKCAAYFHGGQHIDVMRRHMLEVYAHEMITPRVELIEVPYVSEVGDDLIRSALQLRKFMADNGSFLHKSIEQWHGLQASGTGDDNAVQAMRCLLAGYEDMPWVNLQGEQ